jgi:hypothetical protein
MLSLSQANSIIDELAAGGGVQPSPLVVTIRRDERHAPAPLNVSSVQDRTHLRCPRRGPHHGTQLAAGGEKPEDQAAANYSCPACHQNSAHRFAPLTSVYLSFE